MKAVNEGVPKGCFEGGKKCADPASHDKGNGANNSSRVARTLKPFKVK